MNSRNREKFDRILLRINAVKQWTRFNAKHSKLSSNILIHVLRTIVFSVEKLFNGDKLNKLQWKKDKSEQVERKKTDTKTKKMHLKSTENKMFQKIIQLKLKSD